MYTVVARTRARASNVDWLHLMKPNRKTDEKKKHFSLEHAATFSR